MSKQAGFTLIEVLVALVILAVGLLGTASLTLNSLQSSHGASLRSQASAQAGDLGERLRANRAFAVSNDTDYLLASNADPTSKPSCADSNAGCSPTDQAQRDLFEWRTSLATNLPGGTAVITKPSGRYKLVLTWSEAGNRAAVSSYTLWIDL
jgi:type IV pilus assembly protein PilV